MFGRKDAQFLDLGLDQPESRKERRQRLGKYERELRKNSKTKNKKDTGLRLPIPAYGRGGDKVPQNFRMKLGLGIRPHRASTRVFAAAYPFLSQGSLGHEGVYMGQDMDGGGAFCVDPWEWYNKRYIDGTSMVLIGTVGTGKSTCAKSLTTRLVQYGYKAAIASDSKGEWTAVARFLGGGVISVGPGKSTRINPLDEGNRPSLDSTGEPMTDRVWAAVVRTRRLALLGTIVGILLKSRDLEPEEHTALAQALDATVASDKPVTLPTISYFLRNPVTETGREVLDQAKTMDHALSRCLTGDLAGMFDGESTEKFDAAKPIMVIDTKALKGASPEARKITNACTGAWVEAAVTNPDSGRRIIVYEEGWDSITDVYSLGRMVEQWKLARDYGITNLLILHKIADTEMAGDKGSAMHAMAQSLLTDAEIRIAYRQKPDALKATKEALGLTDSEIARIRRLPKGQGLWKIADKFSFVVKNVITPVEQPIFDTDSKMKRQETEEVQEHAAV